MKHKTWQVNPSLSTVLSFLLYHVVSRTTTSWATYICHDNKSRGGVHLIIVRLVALSKLSVEHGMTHIPGLLSLIAALCQWLDEVFSANVTR